MNVATVLPAAVSIETAPARVDRMVAGGKGDLREIDVVRAAEAADRVGEVAPAAYSTSPLVDAKSIPPLPAGARLGELERALIDCRSAGKGIGGGEVERAGAVQGEAPGAGVGARAAGAGLIGDDA